jgi:guanylate kinase
MMHLLSDKTLVMIVGPTSVGKSSLMNEVVTLNPDYARVSGFTTRQRRSNDEPGLYRYVNESEAQAIIASPDLIQYAINPANNKLYGTTTMGYPGRVNLQDTLSGAVAFYTSVPFKRHVVISLCAEPDAWTDWLNARYPGSGIERRNRLKEAVASIEWSLAQSDDHLWLVNRRNELPKTARQLISLVDDHAAQGPAPIEATNLLKAAKTLLSYE